MKPHLPTALRRALLAALAVAALAPAAWAETFTLTQDTSYTYGEGDWSLGAAFKSEDTEVSYTITSNPEKEYSLSFSGGAASQTLATARQEGCCTPVDLLRCGSFLLKIPSISSAVIGDEPFDIKRREFISAKGETATFSVP